MEAEPLDRYDLGVGAVLRDTFRTIGARFAPFLGLAAVAVVPQQVLSVGLNVALEAWSRQVLASPPDDLPFGPLIAAVAVAAGLSLLLVIVHAIVQATLMHASVELLDGAGAGHILDSLRLALGRAVPLTLNVFLYSLLVFFGTLACLIPGMVAALWLAVTQPVCAVERLGPVTSLQRSAELTEGHRPAIFVVFLVLGCCFLGVFTCVLLPVELAVMPANALTGAHADPLSPGQLLSAAIGAVLSTGWYVVVSVTTAVLYVRLRGPRAGIDAQDLAGVFS